MQQRERYDAGALPPADYRKQVLAERKRLATYARSKAGKIHPVSDDEFRIVHESTVQSEIKKYLRAVGFKVWKGLSAAKVGGGATVGLQNGIPDLFALRDGKLLAVEVKRPTKNARDRKTSGEQRAWIRDLRTNGAHAIVAHSVKQVENYLLDSAQLKNDANTTQWPDY